MASAAAHTANAYGRASWAYREVVGSTANSTPATSPTRSPPIRRPIAATTPAAAVMASSDGTRSATSELPASATQPRSSR